MDRTLTFGKYKGQEVKYIILTHIGYIMWCLENIHWFKLSSEEQSLYDAIAIMIKKEGIEMTFPVEIMYNHVENKEALDKLETPFTTYMGITGFKEEHINNPLFKSIEKYVTGEITYIPIAPGKLYMSLAHSMNKMVDAAYADGETTEDIFGGWDVNY